MSRIWTRPTVLSLPAIDSRQKVIIIHRKILIMDPQARRCKPRTLRRKVCAKKGLCRWQGSFQKDKYHLGPTQHPKNNKEAMPELLLRLTSFLWKSNPSSKMSWRHISPQKRNFRSTSVDLPSCVDCVKRVTRKAFGKCSWSASSLRCYTTSSKHLSMNSALSRFLSRPVCSDST